MSRRQQRMVAVISLLIGLGVAAALGFTAIRKNMMYFYTPSDVAAQPPHVDARIRLGGLVVNGSVKRGEGLDVAFAVADCEHTLPVRYTGILPDLFREGQGIVASGRVGSDGVFTADEVLAKHDENYMPPELAEKLTDASGQHNCAEFKSVISRTPRADGMPS
ncbi:cytochrome c maturation protein CcmE [Sinimarinibacterium sp. NLF-5-8]|uniref:cytochrome c maturation protein CcmE n=1 Tax=Sinimarinibacterium sp. NLF-5-8 TaxID=2698684 RepID=UPI00137C2A92|nr:cytochrome c maturation protein CcmE [Sinimarinibacterium sp. NLF-5-8]QHS08685.1 cytochrome c maturation protein CcmE [Sinimarinibacterium sp. NLF-5-8]